MGGVALNLEIELARATLIVGMVITAFVYERWRLLTGGTITGSYVAYLLAFGHWEDVLMWLLLSWVAVLTIRSVTKRLPLPRSWVMYVAMLLPATLHGVMAQIGRDLESDLSPFLIAGLYVTNGLTGYDLVKQGVRRTLLVIGGVVAATLIVILPLKYLVLGDTSSGQDTLFTPIPSATIITGLAVAAVLRLVFKLGTAGIIGAVFLYQVINPESLLPILMFTVLGTFVYRAVRRYVTLTPRQEMQVILVVGGIVGWFGLFWAQFFGLSGAGLPYAYALEPLIVIGLMILEGVRIGLPRALSGTAISLGAIALSAWLCQQALQVFLLGHLALAMVIAVCFAIGWRELRRGIAAAELAGRTHQIHRYNQRDA